MKTKSEYVKSLSEHACTVVFVKTNGEKRRMQCTLREDILPEKQKTEYKRKENDSVVSVWDIEKQDWRSFKIDSVQEFIVHPSV